MMYMNFLRYLFVVFCLAVTANVDATTIQIFLDDEEDLAILTQKAKPENIAGATNKILFEQLNLSNIEFLGASYKRTLRSMLKQDKSAICTLNKVKTTYREKNFLFSLPVNFYISRRLYKHADSPPLSKEVLNKEGSVVSLMHLFNIYRNKLIVIADDLSYGPFLDKQLAQLDSTNKAVRGGSNHYETVHRMFELKRVDFLLSYPVEVMRYAKSNQDKYESYLIADSPRFILGHVMCNKTQVSRQLLERINQILLSNYDTKAFLQAHVNYLPAQEHQFIQDVIARYIVQLGLD
ncbi:MULTISPECIES: hypothetical protein [Pseudoalteromonas]|uniref:hypothetical protein n=1 Tax=Pseudoalteromonas TaxID=53246 RepID=UPI000FFE998B|nr:MULTISPECIES: hypothetical protein [Pseudoalteromonas]MCG9761246.1 hypothetical protein [Pseudoalteromonas sp. Isolate6]NKC21459.1 hypothetical protein [Pseudoalteromonas galatheae]RXE87654.1 hypothetical protein DRB05_06735 [Pseudoalteromonas sp. A757]